MNPRHSIQNQCRRFPCGIDLLRTFSLTFIAFTLLACTGCLTAHVWIDETRTLSVAAEEVQCLEVDTHNGDIRVQAKPEATRIEATLIARYGGFNQKSAEQCREAVELVSETDLAGRHKLHAKWRMSKQPDWQANLNYRIIVPARLATTLNSFNGDIVMEGVNGPCEVTTHNGDVSITTGAPSVHVTTFNGDVHACAPADDMRITSHNGDIHVDSSQSHHLGGHLNTFNGEIVARLGETTSTRLNCKTFNGSIRSTVPWRVIKMDREGAIGVLGDAQSELEIESCNGDISLLK